MNFSTFADAIAHRGRCAVCNKVFSKSNFDVAGGNKTYPALKKKSFSNVTVTTGVELTFSLVNNKIRTKMQHTKSEELVVSCENNRHRHVLRMNFTYSLETMETSNIVLAAENIKFKVSGTEYEMDVNYHKPETRLNRGGRRIVKPGLIVFDNTKEDLIDKINRMYNLLQ